MTHDCIDQSKNTITLNVCQVHVGPMRATSSGWLKIQSKDPRQHPLLEPNYLDTEQDRHEMRQVVKLTREIFAQPAFDAYRDVELAPGSEVQTDQQIDEFVRRKSDSAYHPSCTCKMGDANSDNMAVVDNQCRVIGLDNLRIVDASIMPSIVSGNLNAPTIMMAEKAADIIKGKQILKIFNSRKIPNNASRQSSASTSNWCQGVQVQHCNTKMKLINIYNKLTFNFHGHTNKSFPPLLSSFLEVIDNSECRSEHRWWYVHCPGRFR